MQSLGFSGESEDALREYFHSADENQDGILEIDQFLLSVEKLSLISELIRRLIEGVYLGRTSRR